MSWFTDDRPSTAGNGGGRGAMPFLGGIDLAHRERRHGSGQAPLWPDLRQGAPLAEAPEAIAAAPSEPFLIPGLSFDEGDLAKACAATAWRRRQEAEAKLRADLETRRAAALDRAASALAEALGGRQAESDRVREQILAIAEAVGGALAGAASDAASLAAGKAVLGALADQAVQARLSVDAAVAETLRAKIAELAAQGGLAGTVEVAADDRLPPGAMQLTWSEGWAEHSPEAIRRQVADLLDGYRPTAAAVGPSDA